MQQPFTGIQREQSERMCHNVQRWPQDPCFPFLSLVLHFSEVWKCEITLLSFLIPSSTLLRCVEVRNSLTKSG